MFYVDTANIRAGIVAALGGLTATVDGASVTVSAYPSRPDTVNAYDAWPEFRWANPITGCIAETNWHVLMALPTADITTAITSGDVLMSAMANALMALGRVERVEPVIVVVTDQPNAGLAGIRVELTI